MCTSQGQEEPEITWCTTFSWTFYKEQGLPCVRNPNLSSPEYLRQGEISVCKVPVIIKEVPVKNNYFLHPKFELHRYQQVNGFPYCHSFCWKKYGAYIIQELIMRLMLTWIWYDLIKVSQIWSQSAIF